MVEALLSQDYIMADETPIKVLDSKHALLIADIIGLIMPLKPSLLFLITVKGEEEKAPTIFWKTTKGFYKPMDILFTIS